MRRSRRLQSARGIDLQQPPRVGVGRRLEQGRARRHLHGRGRAYMTITSSATSATTPRSCVIRMIAVPNSPLHPAEEPDDLRLHGHVECGGRLVGDEQLRVAARARGRSSRAGASRRRTGAGSRRRGESGCGMPTQPEELDGRRARACAASPVRAPESSPTICHPMRYSGWRLDRGFWKTIAMPRPRTARSWSGDIVEQILSLEQRLASDGGVRPRVSPTIGLASATLLPDPDSPTMPSTWPRATENERPLTALRIPSGGLEGAPAGRGRRAAARPARTDSPRSRRCPHATALPSRREESLAPSVGLTKVQYYISYRG